MAVTFARPGNYIHVCDCTGLDVTDCDCNDALVSEHLDLLGERVRQARLDLAWSKEQAAREAEISSITWKRVEDGLPVHDVKRAAVLRVLGLDHDGQRLADAATSRDYVAAPGAREDGGDSDGDVLRAIRAMQEDLRSMSERLARLEQRGTEPMGGPGSPP